MNKLYFLCGVQGSGKTTYARENKERLNAEIISTDRIRLDYAPIEEKDVFPKAYELIKENLKEKNVIFDATNITVEARKVNIDNVFNIVNKDEIELICICLIVNKEICKQRVEKRNQLDGEIYLPLEVIDSYSERFELPTVEEGFKEILFIKDYSL